MADTVTQAKKAQWITESAVELEHQTPETAATPEARLLALTAQIDWRRTQCSETKALEFWPSG